MNKDCNIARDLMPLVIDEVASGESKNFVEAHIGDCPPCRDYFEGMKNAFHAMTS